MEVCEGTSSSSSEECPSPSSSYPGQASCSSLLFPTPQDTSFRQCLNMMKSWFPRFSDDQKNILLKEMISQSRSSQIHLLSSLLEPRLHEDCPPNCQDPFASLPTDVALRILSFLDPVSLCKAALVCRTWGKFSSEAFLWRRLCQRPHLYRMSSPAAEANHIRSHTTVGGIILWKNAFSERYRLWRNWMQGRCVVRTFEGHSQGISCVQFEETRIVSGSSDNTIRLWDIRTNSQLATMTLTGHSATVRCLQLNGNRLASGSNDTTIKIWDLSQSPTWSSIACRVTMVGHSNYVRCLQMDAQKVISGSYDRSVKQWDMATGQCKSTLRGHEEAVLCLQYDDEKIVSGSSDNSIKLWDVRSGQCTLTMHNAHQNSVTCLQFDDYRIVSGSLDRTIKFWDVRTGKWLQTLDWMQGEGHTGVIRCLQADSWRIVSAADDKTLKVWNLHNGKRINTLKSHNDGVTCLQFDDKRIVSGSYDKTVKLWDFSIG